MNLILAIIPGDLGSINQLGYIAHIRGEIDEAKRLFGIVVDQSTDASDRAIGLCNIGLVEGARGNLDEGEKYQKDSLAINQ